MISRPVQEVSIIEPRGVVRRRAERNSKSNNFKHEENELEESKVEQEFEKIRAEFNSNGGGNGSIGAQAAMRFRD